MESDNSELGEGKQVPNNISSSDDEWDSDEDDDNTAAGYTPLPQDPIENGEESYGDDHNSDSEKDVLTPQPSQVSHGSVVQSEELFPSQLAVASPVSMEQGVWWVLTS